VLEGAPTSVRQPLVRGGGVGGFDATAFAAVRDFFGRCRNLSASGTGERARRPAWIRNVS
jgi:hypothetical protein